MLTVSELEKAREPLADLIAHAQDELDRLYKLVRPARYTILLCNDQGVVVDHRGEEAEAEQFRYWGIWAGGMWSEEIEGTNGIGTCIAEQRPVTVHRTQHFRTRHTGLSCSGAPVFDGDGKLAAVLDVSSFDSELSEHSHALTGALTEASARAIEERLFRERFHREWIISIALPDAIGPTVLLAVDRDQRIVGADRSARMSLLSSDHSLEQGVSLWDIFDRDCAPFCQTGHGDIPAGLVPVGTADFWPAVFTPPANAPAAPGGRESAASHSRSRLDILRSLRESTFSREARGGLPPAALRRVREYAESHLEEHVSLEMLAACAGLSVYHFARAFKQSEGVTPHSYLLQRRIERAQELLTDTDLPVSEIALAAGFSDQSHLARHFRERVGVPPSTYRWSQR